MGSREGAGRMRKAKISLKAGLMTTIVICWLVPIVIVVVLAGILLGNSYRQSLQQEVDAAAENAVEQVQARLMDAMNDSKMVSYDGTVRSAYRWYMSAPVIKCKKTPRKKCSFVAERREKR